MNATNFVWRVSRNHYRWEGTAQARHLVEDTGNRGYREYAPLKSETGLFRTFAELKPTSQNILDFANRYGLLGVTRQTIENPGPEEYFDVWKSQIKIMQEAVDRWLVIRKWRRIGPDHFFLVRHVNNHLHQSTWSHIFGRIPLDERAKLDRIAQVNVDQVTSLAVPPSLQILGMNRRLKVVLGLRPCNLLNALWLQFAMAIANNAKYRRCKKCNNWFEVSTDARRSDAQYCRVSCRTNAYKARKKTAQVWAKRGLSIERIAEQLHTTEEKVRAWIAEVEPEKKDDTGQK